MLHWDFQGLSEWSDNFTGIASEIAHALIICQRICSRYIVWVLDMPQEMISQRRIGAPGVRQRFRPCRFVKVPKKKKRLNQSVNTQSVVIFHTNLPTY